MSSGFANGGGAGAGVAPTFSALKALLEGVCAGCWNSNCSTGVDDERVPISFAKPAGRAGSVPSSNLIKYGPVCTESPAVSKMVSPGFKEPLLVLAMHTLDNIATSTSDPCDCNDRWRREMLLSGSGSQTSTLPCALPRTTGVSRSSTRVGAMPGPEIWMLRGMVAK